MSTLCTVHKAVHPRFSKTALWGVFFLKAFDDAKPTPFLNNGCGDTPSRYWNRLQAWLSENGLTKGCAVDASNMANVAHDLKDMLAPGNDHPESSHMSTAAVRLLVALPVKVGAGGAPWTGSAMQGPDPVCDGLCDAVQVRQANSVVVELCGADARSWTANHRVLVTQALGQTVVLRGTGGTASAPGARSIVSTVTAPPPTVWGHVSV